MNQQHSKNYGIDFIFACGVHNNAKREDGMWLKLIATAAWYDKKQVLKNKYKSWQRRRDIKTERESLMMPMLHIFPLKICTRQNADVGIKQHILFICIRNKVSRQLVCFQPTLINDYKKWMFLLEEKEFGNRWKHCDLFKLNQDKNIFIILQIP